MTAVTTRRTLGTGPEASAQGIRATQADLLAVLPGVRLPDLSELRARGVVASHLPAQPKNRRSLGAGPAEGSPGTSRDVA
ncbi:hypothetical protein [Streptomyces canus]|uniref:hypothetical protein n=1 Tax=Streptomyces canus TaxID=58343 RepID=UPI0032445D13